MFRITAFTFAIFLCATTTVYAADKDVNIKYHSDPVFKSLHNSDSHPMSEVKSLAEAGDVRAQFILADLYAKGKGGFAKSTNTARHWFEESARLGNHFSFIRLAALEKRIKKPVDAYKWYTLAIDTMAWGDDNRKWAEKSRDALVQTARLDKKDIKKAKEDAKTWQTETRQLLKERKEKAKDLQKGEKENVKN